MGVGNATGHKQRAQLRTLPSSPRCEDNSSLLLALDLPGSVMNLTVRLVHRGSELKPRTFESQAKASL